MNYFQGDIIHIDKFNCPFVVVSKNAYIKATNTIHACPILNNVPEGPYHIAIHGTQNTSGTVIIEQIKYIDCSFHSINKIDWIPYYQIMNISDAIQSIFEYD